MTTPLPPLRDQVLLNGTWDNGAVVPQYAGIKDFDRQTFARTVAVPAAWAGKLITLEFGAVNFVADVFVNDTKLATHVGGWMPFTVDVTKSVRPGESFALKVAVQGPKRPPIVDANGKPLWPVGAWSNKGGIADDVWLRAYGVVHIVDAFIQTSVKNKTLTIDYTLTNADARPRTVAIRAEAAKSNNGVAEKTLRSEALTLAPGERRVVRVQESWENPTLYFPDRPALYQLRSRLEEAGSTLDTETRRFGFREITISGNQFRWNGVRINLFGDYQSIDGGYHSSSSDLSPAGWPQTVDKIKAMNIRVLRFHHCPVPQYLLDVCDEKGLLVVSESANYAREYHVGCDKNAYIANAVQSVAPWIRAQRNHPSIYLWSATNEMTYPHLGGFSPEHCKAVGNAVAALDPTRPVGYDGDTADGRKKYGRVEGALVNHHYPEGYNKEPTGSIYSWANLVNPAKPTGSGEMLHTNSPDPKVQTAIERSKWWLGLWLRGLRYTDWTDVRPACYWFAAKDGESADPAQRQRGLNLRNALAPIALFDKAYDDLGIAPYVSGTTPGGVLPTVAGGATLDRTLVLYNDEFAGTTVDVEVEVRAGGKTVATGTKTFTVPLGEHRDIPVSFVVPSGGEMELILRTTKNGARRFEEARRFTITGQAAGPPGANTVRIGEATQPARSTP